MKVLVEFYLAFDLKFEISDGKNLVKLWGRTFLPAREAREMSERISGHISEQLSGNISETSSQILRLSSETSFSRRAVLTLCPLVTTIRAKLSECIRVSGVRRSPVIAK